MGMRLTGGELKGRALKTGQGPGYRPATARVREALFSMLDSRGVRWPGVRALDLFAGTGALSFEALSRGARQAVLVEQEPSAAKIIRANAAALGLDDGRARIEVKDAVRFLAGRSEAFEIVFIDPPYGQRYVQRCLRPLAARGWVAPGGFVLAEVERDVELNPAALAEELHWELAIDRNYGQTRILAWKNLSAPRPSIPEPSTP